MKTSIVLLFALLTSAIYGQSDDCKKWVKYHEDKVGGKGYYVNKESIIVTFDNQQGLNITVMETNKSIIFSIVAVGAGRCIEEKAKIQILFTDDSRIELQTNNDFNCENSAVVYFLNVFGRKWEYEQLSTKNIQTMRVWTSRGYVEENFSEAKAEQLKNVFRCVKVW
jgi:hypothetical protein